MSTRSSHHVWGIALAALLAGVVFAAVAAASQSSQQLDVYAAASLAEAFEELEHEFEAAFPGTDVRVTTAGSQILRLQIEQGAPADVFASAHPQHLEALSSAGLLSPTTAFATNRLVILTPEDDPSGVATFADLPRAQRLVIGTQHVPIGIYTRQMLQRAESATRPGFAAEVLESAVSLESNVRLVRAKVELGEADAAVVYASDAVGASSVRVVPIPAAVNVHATYAMGTVSGGGSQALADHWIAFVRSTRGRSVLAAHGFEAP